MAEATVIEFCTHVGYIKSHYIEDKSPLKGRDRGQVTHLKFCGPNDISGLAEARLVKFYAHIGYTISQPKDDKPPLKGRG